MLNIKFFSLKLISLFFVLIHVCKYNVLKINVCITQNKRPVSEDNEFFIFFNIFFFYSFYFPFVNEKWEKTTAK